LLSPRLRLLLGLSACLRTLFLALREQEDFQQALKDDARLAKSPAELYRLGEHVNQRMIDVAVGVYGCSEKEAAASLQQKIMLPVRKPMKGFAMVVAYQYIKRTVSHFNSAITNCTVSTWLKRMNALKDIGAWSTGNRRTLNLSAPEALDQLRGDAFIKDACGRIAMLDSLVAVISEFGGTDEMVCWTGANRSSRVIRCIFALVAWVSFRVRFSTMGTVCRETVACGDDKRTNVVQRGDRPEGLLGGVCAAVDIHE